MKRYCIYSHCGLHISILILFFGRFINSYSFLRRTVSRTGYTSPIFSVENENLGNVLSEAEQTPGTIKTRRLRYSGKYPKKFSEKYKEIGRNTSTIQHVLMKGNTPAGQHVSIMVDECIQHMKIPTVVTNNMSAIIVDCTLGYGGHSLRILRECDLKCRIISFDKDLVELEKTQYRISKLIDKKLETTHGYLNCSSNDIFLPVHDSFGNIKKHMTTLGVLGKVDAILADIGISSMQLDDPSRGFTFKSESVLDMRMDQSQSLTAQTLLKSLNPESLSRILIDNSDEAFAVYISESIYSDAIPQTTSELTECVRQGVRRAHTVLNLADPSKAEFDKSITRTMQAIRIEVNGEFEALDNLLKDAPSILQPGGRIVILTFHSGEDRRVKKAFKQGYKDGVYSAWSDDVIRTSFEERRRNPRSKCAKLRFVRMYTFTEWIINTF